MPNIKFHKYQGTGNDFIMVDDRRANFEILNLDLIGKICDRKFGVGADGIILLHNHPVHDFQMIYFNPDGSQSLCGNGSRCAVQFASALGLIKDRCTFLAVDGLHEGFIIDGLIHIKMPDVTQFVDVDGDFFVDTGSPHHIKLVPQVSGVDVFEEGRAIRYSSRYQPHGTNVNFVEISELSTSVRTYERGVEDETLSCGTGVAAVALVLAQKGFASPVSLRTRGGILQVSFKKQADGSYTDVYLIGPAEKVFEGTFAY